MNGMPTDLRSARLASMPIEAYPQPDNLDNRKVLLLAPLQDYTVMSIAQAEIRNQKTVSSFISTHLRACVSLGLLLIVGVSFLSTSTLGGGIALQHLVQSISLFAQSQPIRSQNISLAPHFSAITNASQQLMRISQLDPNQYGSNSEYNTWAYSACSTAAMTEVFNSYGDHFRITDVLNVESKIGAITPDLGLVDPSGIASTATKFGFKTQWGNDGSLDQIISTGNSGKPVIVGFPPDRYDGGHLLVLLGGDSNNVFLADTSLWNHRVISRAQFLQWWGGFYAVVTPNN